MGTLPRRGALRPHERWRAAAARRPRLSRLRRAAGPRARVLATTGLMPAIGYGAEVFGLSDAELADARRLAAVRKAEMVAAGTLGSCASAARVEHISCVNTSTSMRE